MEFTYLFITYLFFILKLTKTYNKIFVYHKIAMLKDVNSLTALLCCNKHAN